MVKPYTGTLDSLLEFGHHLGDLLFVFANIPVHFVKSYFDRWTGRSQTNGAVPQATAFVASNIEGEEPPVIPSYPADLPADPAQAYGTTRSRQRPLQGAHQRATSSSAAPNKPQIYAASASQKIWVPPASALKDSPPSETKDLPIDDELQRAHRREIDEWRQYEPFPSAYPVSPVQASTQLPSFAAFGGIYAAAADPPPAYSQVPSSSAEQHFRQSLKPLRESMNPDSDGDLSDDHQTNFGVHTDNEDGMSVDEDMDDEDEDDEFDVTLRTPPRITRVKNVSNMTTTSVDNSTGLSTVDHDSGFRTRTESGSTASDSASFTGHKRALSTHTEDDAPVRPPLRAKISDNGTVRAKPTTRTRIQRPPPISRIDSRASESSASGVENRQTVPSEAAKKRRGAASPQRKGTVRRPLAARPVGANVKPKIGDATTLAAARKSTAIPRVIPGTGPTNTKPVTRPAAMKAKTSSSGESMLTKAATNN